MPTPISYVYLFLKGRRDRMFTYSSRVKRDLMALHLVLKSERDLMSLCLILKSERDLNTYF
jgi:hypothetical protein